MLYRTSTSSAGEGAQRSVDIIYIYKASPDELPQALWDKAYGDDPPAGSVDVRGRAPCRKTHKDVKKCLQLEMVGQSDACPAPFQQFAGMQQGYPAMQQLMQQMPGGVGQFLMHQALMQQQMQQQMQQLMVMMGARADTSQGNTMTGSSGLGSTMPGLERPTPRRKSLAAIADAPDDDTPSDSQGHSGTSDSQGTADGLPQQQPAMPVAEHIAAMQKAMQAKGGAGPTAPPAKGNVAGTDTAKAKAKAKGKCKATGKAKAQNAGTTAKKRPAAASNAAADFPTPSSEEAAKYSSRASYTSKYSHGIKKLCLDRGMKLADAKANASKYVKLAGAAWDSM